MPTGFHTPNSSYKYLDGKKFHFLGERDTKVKAGNLAAKYRLEWGKGARVFPGQVLKYSVWGENPQQ
jgi:hypothetical protein